MLRSLENIVDFFEPRILLSGETGGTGASTTAEKLSKVLDIPVISGGKYFRGLAHQFELFRQEQLQSGENLTELEMYEHFLSICLVIFEQHQLAGLLEFLRPSINSGANGEVLANFSAAIAKGTSQQKKIDPFWDHVVDQSTLQEALSMPGFILESKLAILKMELDESQDIVSAYHGLAVPFLKVLLQLHPAIAAKRIEARENRAVTKSEVLLRQKRDFTRYGQLYHIHARPVSFQDLAANADIKIDTFQNSPDQVVQRILQGYLEKVSQIGEYQSELAFPLIQKLGAGLA